MSKTFLEVQTSVLARLGMLDDGANNPSVVGHVKECINGALAELSLEWDWLHKQARAIVNWPAGTTQQALPAGIAPERIRQVNYRTTTVTYPLEPGVHVEDEGRYDGVPVYWRAMYEHQATGAAAADPDSALILLDPYPTEGGELWIDYQTASNELSADGDLVGGDPSIVILRAAAEASLSYAPHLTGMLQAKADKMAQGLRERSVTRRKMSMGPPKRIPAGPLRRYLRRY